MLKVEGADTFIPGNTFDSRDVEARIEYLESLGEIDSDGDTVDDGLDDDEREELTMLRAFRDDEVDSGEWRHGITFVRDDYFEDYARDLAAELGDIKSEVSWPYTCIDWEQAADELRTDYTEVEYDGETYLYR